MSARRMDDKRMDDSVPWHAPSISLNRLCDGGLFSSLSALRCRAILNAMARPVLPPIQPDLVLAYQFVEEKLNYTERDVALYALGIGAPGSDPCDPIELPFVYHPHGQSSIKVLPTFAVLFPLKLTEILQSIPGLHYDPSLLLHGEQYVEIYKPLPTRGNIRNNIRVSGLHDKGKAAIVEIEVVSSDENSIALCMNRNTLFLRGAGGFSTSSPPFSYSQRTVSSNSTTAVASRGGLPDVVFEDHTSPAQALLYRLSGDYNPLHVDPSYAEKAGFPRPILHGLCTLGFATRAVIRCCCGGDPGLVQSVQGRFLLHVYPGETLVTEMWWDDAQSRVTFQVKVKERGKVVLSGSIGLRPTMSRL